MTYHRGRLIDHVHLRVANLAHSKVFYRAVIEALGWHESIQETDTHFAIDELWIDEADGPVSHLHLALQVDSAEAVKAFYDAALGAGGTDNGAPGERPYHPGYFAAFVLDPDGNNIEAVHHGPAQRSAVSVVITPQKP